MTERRRHPITWIDAPSAPAPSPEVVARVQAMLICEELDAERQQQAEQPQPTERAA